MKTKTAPLIAALLLSLATPAVASESTQSAFGDPTSGLPERVTPAEELEAPTAQTMSVSEIVVHGGGWGHGIGMSQWGAKALADQGRNYQQILSHFYKDVQFGGIAPQGSIVQHADPFHVGIGPNRTTATFVPKSGSVQICLVDSSCHTANADEVWTFSRAGDVCELKKGSSPVTTVACFEPSPGKHGEVAATLTWTQGTRLLFTSFSPNRTYARGHLEFTTAPSGRFHATAVVGMDEYLYGLGEVPNTWGVEALKAQVVAARTFALYRILALKVSTSPSVDGGRLLECSCHLRATTADQAYRGWESNPHSAMTEGDPNNGAKWKQAVDQTSGTAMWHAFHGSQAHTRPMEAYYFSSTGANTENNEDRWGGSAYAYLRSISDPGATSWTKGFSSSDFASRLDLDEVVWVEIPTRFASGRPKTIVVTGKVAGSQAVREFSSAQFASRLGLQSQWVHKVTGLLHPQADRVVLHNPRTGEWTYQSAGGGSALSTIYYGNPGDIAFMGDWNCNGIDTPGLYRQSDGYVYLRNSNTQGIADITFFFGNPGDIPIVGDFNGDGCDSVSIYRPAQARFYIINKLGSADKGLGAAEHSFVFGNVGDVPFVGDWNGDGIDTPGLRRPSDGFVYLRNTNTQGIADISFWYGNPGDVVFSGDWDGDGRDSIGLYRPSNGTVYLRNALSTGIAEITFPMGGNQHKAVGGAY